MMRRSACVGLGVVAMALVGMALPAVAADDPAVRAPSGTSLVVPEAHRRLGAVYHALPGRDRQVSFVSDAPVEMIKGQSNRVIGYCIAGKENAAALQKGAWRLPVASIRTGIAKRDEHLREKNWLDAESHPDIIFSLRETKDVKEEKAGTWTATLVGDMTIHGVTKAMTIPGATVALMPASEETAKVAKGDLLAIRAKYTVKLSDHGVENKIVGQKVAEEIVIDTTLYMSTVPPEEQEAK